MRVILVLVICAFVKSEPQLDLPHSTAAPLRNGPEVLILPNSYANEKPDIQPRSSNGATNYGGFDNDRSQRYG